MSVTGIKRWSGIAVAVALAGTSAQAFGATVAYWRFENGTAGQPVPHAGADGAFDPTTPDVSGNGNGLSAFTQASYAGFNYRANTPAPVVPNTLQTNNLSVQNTGGFPAFSTGPGATGLNATTITPAAFTIEASYKGEAVGGNRTIVGRDARNVQTGSIQPSSLYLQVLGNNSIGISYVDVGGVAHSAFSAPNLFTGFSVGTDPTGAAAPWYNVAVTSDGTFLTVYVNNLQVAQTNMTVASPSTNYALSAGTTNSVAGDDPFLGGAFTVGRGLYNGRHVDRAYGFIDEVRISNTALAPTQFLMAPVPEPTTLAAALLGLGALAIRTRRA
jgi:hypothetical protein